MCLPVVFNSDAPECRSSAATFFVYDQPINVTCQVEAFPPVKNFHWRWNLTSEGLSFRLLTTAQKSMATIASVGLPAAGGKQVASSEDGNVQWSVVQITARQDGETAVRELFCYGINEIATQEQPCKFLIKVASTLLGPINIIKC